MIILRDISVLQAISWVNSAWQEVKPDTIQRCFAKCGFTESSVSGSVNTEVTFEEEDSKDDYPLSVLKMSTELFGCQFQELLDRDRAFHTCDNNLMEWDRPASEILRLMLMHVIVTKRKTFNPVVRTLVQVTLPSTWKK